jgi:superfamily II DNA or RNA helicase
MERMFDEIIAGRPPSLIDLPTGAGKTDLIAIWLIALAWYGHNWKNGKPIPRRLVWVVNRRVLVQQVYDLAAKLERTLDEQLSEETKAFKRALRSLYGFDDGNVFNIVQLRGQRLDDREWSFAPTQPQLIIGTVDQIGSRLLFQGYGQGKWSRPLHAGLLGTDAWVCIDEAHLVPAFAVTLRQIHERVLKPSASVPTSIADLFAKLPSWFSELSATPGLWEPRCGKAFRLDPEKGEESDDAIAPRIVARNTRRVIWKPLADQKKLADTLANEAIRIAKKTGGQAVAVFCCKATDADKVAKEIEKNFPGRVLVVTGRLRGYERDRLEEDVRFRRFKTPHSEAMTDNEPPTFLVGTSAAEVGLDADASAIVCDFASLITLVQRLGRLDRRGDLSVKAREGIGSIPTMTIIGGLAGKATERQLNVLANRLRQSFDHSVEFDSHQFTGAYWTVVIGKDKAPTVDDECDQLDAHQLSGDDIVNPEGIIEKLKARNDAFSSWLASNFKADDLNDLDADSFIEKLNRIIESETFYDELRFADVKLSDKAKNQVAKTPKKKALFKLNKLLLQEVYKAEFSPDPKHGCEDAVLAATWRVLGLPVTQENEETEEAEATNAESESDEGVADANNSVGPTEIQAAQPGKWLQSHWAPITAGPVVVPPLSDATLRRWAATTPRPTPHLPVHPWLYGLLPDDEGTPLVAIAFRLELDVLAHCETRDEESDESNNVWEKVKAVLTKFPPLRSEFHLAPIQHVRAWLEQQEDTQIALAHYDGETWDSRIDPKRVSSNSVILLPTSCISEQVGAMQEAGIIPKGMKGSETQPLWDVFEKMAADGARYKRHVEVTKTCIRASDCDPVYRVDLEAGRKPIPESEPISPSDDEWKRAHLKLDFEKGGIRFTLRYWQRKRCGEVAYQPLRSHLDTAGNHAEQLAKALAPDDDILSEVLKSAASDHDLGKDHAKWQRAMGNTLAWRQAEGLDDSVRIAKPVTEMPANAGGYRHEWGTLMNVNDKALSFLRHLSDAERRFYHDLYLHLIAAHHGYFRPSLPDRGFDSPPTPAKQNPLRIECIERAARLQKQLGFWRLAYLESLLKVADVAASRSTDPVPRDETDNLDEA